ncbi:hypothetical protein Trydic_g22469 [Trypoxylus dichotomus]
MIFNDELNFWMNSYVNKHNCRMWDDANPHEVHQVAMHPQKVTLPTRNPQQTVTGTCSVKNDVGNHRHRRTLLNYDSRFYLAQIERYGVTCGPSNAALSAAQRMPRWRFCVNDLRV